jgi:outer membrane protein assembly factor BamB
MKRFLTLIAATATLLLFSAADWRQFRGTDLTGVAADSRLPTQFDVKTGENVAWTKPLLGKGVSGPIVVRDRVFVTASSGPVTQNRLHVLAFDAKTGQQVWKRDFWATGRCYHHPTSANAAPTPASDGERIFAFFSSNDLVCLDLDGNLLWYRGLAHDYPKAGNDVGMSSSPVVVGKTVVVQIENQGDSFAAGIDTETGETRWRIDRPHAANWASPGMLRLKDGKELVLLTSGKGLTAHDPLTGEQKWSYDSGCSIIPSVTAANGRIYLPANGLTVLDAGEGSAPSLAWESNKVVPGNSSPVVDGDKVYTLRGSVLVCGNEKDGDVLWQERVKGTFWATPVIAGEHAYCVNQEGQCLVVQLGEKGQVVSTNELGEAVLGTPAVAGDALYIRGEKHLIKIAGANK